jgi:hypothetical protein
MTIVKWDKPKQTLSKEEWQSLSADSAPPGVYTPNMSKQDREAWKGTVKGTKSGRPQVELRRSFGGAQMLIIVCLKGGYTYKNYKPDCKYGGDGTKPYNMHIALNGGAQLTLKDWDELNLAVREAIAHLFAITPGGA